MKLLWYTLSYLLFFPSSLLGKKEHLNIILIFTDDQGYQDLSCFGSTAIKTPHIDRLASEGRKLTSFYVASPVCSPSRAALLTGCYPKRVGMHQHVLFPESAYGLNPSEYTLGKHFKENGYATACIGKWHLGHHPEVLPRAHGFDSYYGIPYSNDMNHPDNQDRPQMGPAGMDLLWKEPETTLTKWQTPLVENETIIEIPVDQRTITRRYTDQAISFVEKNRETPFFLYLAHSMPHIPLYLPEDRYQSNPKNAYTLVIEHIDQEVGRLVQTLESNDLDKNTLIIFTSDNGPWLHYKHHAGSAKPLRDGKSTYYEGGVRVPCIVWSPSQIPAGTSSSQILSTLDLLPTLANLAETNLPENHQCDGYDASDFLLGKTSSPRKEFIYYSSHGELAGIRIGEWKYLAHPTPKNGKTEKNPALYNLNSDLSETTNLSSQHPEIVAQLETRMRNADQEITRNTRPPWRKSESLR